MFEHSIFLGCIHYMRFLELQLQLLELLLLFLALMVMMKDRFEHKTKHVQYCHKIDQNVPTFFILLPELCFLTFLTSDNIIQFCLFFLINEIVRKTFAAEVIMAVAERHLQAFVTLKRMEQYSFHFLIKSLHTLSLFSGLTICEESSAVTTASLLESSSIASFVTWTVSKPSGT